MRIGVIDIGSNTARLLVASVEGAGLRRLEERRAHLGLGAAVERRGAISGRLLRLTAERTEEYAAAARALGVCELEVVVTAPGRQARNRSALVEALRTAARAPVRILSSEDEGRYAFAGGAAALGRYAGLLAVCDVGGGSTELALGTGAREPDEVRSFDLGSLRLTGRFFDGRSSPAGVSAARTYVRQHLGDLDGVRPDEALVAGGTARALRRLAGRSLDGPALRRVVAELTGRKPERVATAYDLDPARARSLLAGAIIVSELQRSLGVPLGVARWGLREGAALALAEIPAAA